MLECMPQYEHGMVRQHHGNANMGEDCGNAQRETIRNREARLHRCLIVVRLCAADLVFVFLVALPDGPRGGCDCLAGCFCACLQIVS